MTSLGSSLGGCDNITRMMFKEINPLTGENFSNGYKYDLSLSPNKRIEMPMFKQLCKFGESLSKDLIIVIAGTGAGKSTQIPCYLTLLQRMKMKINPRETRKIICTQPRQLAAVSTARSVAKYLDVPLGSYVGYTHGSGSENSTETIYETVTEMVLINEITKNMDDIPDKYSTIIVDEAHERNVDTDLLLMLLKHILYTKKSNKSFNVIIMSATIDPLQFISFFLTRERERGEREITHEIMNVPGTNKEITNIYWEKGDGVENYLLASAEKTKEIHTTNILNSGNILIFLSSREEVLECCRIIDGFGLKKLVTCPLYSKISQKQEEAATGLNDPELAEMKVRKVIVSTNVSETSITIKNLGYAIDCGLSKKKVYNPINRTETILISPISQASLMQRAGRLGRIIPGTCYHLYTKETARSFEKESSPKILSSNITSFVFKLIAAGVKNPVLCQYISAPAPITLMRALEELVYFKIIEKPTNIEEGCRLVRGNELANTLPIPVNLSRAIISGLANNCANEVITIISLLKNPDVFIGERKEIQETLSKFSSRYGDHLTLLNVFVRYLQIKGELKTKNEERIKRGFVSFASEKEKEKGDSDSIKGLLAENHISYSAMKDAEELRERIISEVVKKSRIDERYVIKKTNYNSPNLETNILKCLFTGNFMSIGYFSESHYETIKEGVKTSISSKSSLFSRNPKWVMFNDIEITDKSVINIVSEIDPKWILDTEITGDLYSLGTFPESNAKTELFM